MLRRLGLFAGPQRLPVRGNPASRRFAASSFPLQ